MSIVLRSIEEFEIGDSISQSRNIYRILSKNENTCRVRVVHEVFDFTCEFEYGSKFLLVREASK